MGQLEWYHGIDAAHQHSAYTLAWRLCRNEETAVKGIIPTAVDIAYKSVRRRDRRMRASDIRWKITLSDPQLLQIAILEAAKRQGVAPRTSPWLPYIQVAACPPKSNALILGGSQDELISLPT